jgi:hypothetical protein
MATTTASLITGVDFVTVLTNDLDASAHCSDRPAFGEKI